MPTLTKFLGRNGQKSPTELADQECTLCQNFFLSGLSMVARGGSSLAFTDALDTTDAVNGLHRVYISGTPYWVWSVGSTIRSLKTGSQVTIATLSVANSATEFVEANGSLYIISGNATDKVWKSDGTAGGTAAHPSANCPKASSGVFVNGRLFLNDLNTTSRVWISNTNDPDTFLNQNSSAVATDGGYIDVSTGDGDSIQALAQVGSTVFIFKQRSVHQLSGTSFTGSNPFVLTPLVQGIGCRAPRSITPTEMGVLFMDSDGRIRYYWGFARQFFSEIGRPMEDITLVTSAAYMHLASAVYFNRRYMLSFPSASATVNNQTFVLDLRLAHPLMGYWVDTEMPSCWTEITGNYWTKAEVTNGGSEASFPYYADATANGKVWQFLTGTTDNGAAIPYAWKSKAYGADQPKVVKSLTEVLTATRTLTTAVTHQAYTDLSSSTAATKAITPANGAAYSVNTWRPGESVRGSVLQAGITGSSSVGAEIVAASWDWSPRRAEPVQG